MWIIVDNSSGKCLAIDVNLTTSFIVMICFYDERYYVPLTSAVNNGEESQERRCTCECAPYFFIAALLLGSLLESLQTTHTQNINSWIINLFVVLLCGSFLPYYVRQLSAVNNGEENQERRRTCECAPYFFLLVTTVTNSCILLFIKFYMHIYVLLASIFVLI